LSVHLEELTIQYGSLKAVDSLTLTFPQGSTGLLGANGAGKSSLIKGLLGLVPLHSGSGTILGRQITAEKKYIRQLTGYMPEDDCLIPGLSGIGMVQYAGELCGMTRQDAIERGHEILFLVGLGEARYRKVETYSQGMKQRIKLAQAIVHDPKLLFLDEPTSGMDPKGRLEMLDLIETITANGNMSIILATHLLPDVERTCSRVVILHKGRAAKQADMSSLRGQYSGAFSVRVEGSRESFVNALNASGCTVKPDGKHLLDVVLPDGLDSDFILKTAKKTGAQLRRLLPAVQTLEDVFVKLVKEDAHADLQ
jgi:ABC-2 type transport system ATP-binding protein